MIYIYIYIILYKKYVIYVSYINIDFLYLYCKLCKKVLSFSISKY